MQLTHGELVRSTSSSPVYIILRDRRRHIPDPGTFQYLGFIPADVHELSDPIVQNIPEAPPLPSLSPGRAQEREQAAKRAIPEDPVKAIARRTIPGWLALLMIGTIAVAGILLALLLPPHIVQISGLTPTQTSQQISQTRGTLVQLVAGVAVLLGLYFTLQSVQVGRATLLATVENQLSERYAKSLDLVKSSNTLEVRLGGVLALERIALTSPVDRTTIQEFLCIIVRTASPGASSERSAIEMHAILSAISRISVRMSGSETIDLRGARISGVVSDGINIKSADLGAASIESCTFMHSNLAGARLTVATLSDVDLRFSDMRNLMARGAVILGSDLSWSDLTDAILIGTDLRDTSFVGSKLAGALMIGADLRGANLRSTDLQLVDLSDALLTGAHADSVTKWPPGFDANKEAVSYGD